MEKKKLLKSEKMRMKQDALRAQGKEPKKSRRSGHLINSGLGSMGMNLGSSGGDPGRFDRMGTNIEESKRQH